MPLHLHKDDDISKELASQHDTPSTLLTVLDTKEPIGGTVA